MKQTPIAVVGEGITEEYYIESLKDIDTIKNGIKFFPASSSSPRGIEKAIKKAVDKGYTHIYCMIDMDVQHKDLQSYERYKKFKNTYHNKKHNGQNTTYLVLFFESYPCTELFFRYYFDYTTAEQTNNGLKAWLKAKIGYEAKVNYLAHTHLHATLCQNNGNLENAIRASIQSLHDREYNNFACCYTEIGYMIRLLGYTSDGL